MTHAEHLRIVGAIREEQRDLARAATARAEDALAYAETLLRTARTNEASAQRVFEKAVADYAAAQLKEQP